MLNARILHLRELKSLPTIRVRSTPQPSALSSNLAAFLRSLGLIQCITGAVLIIYVVVGILRAWLQGQSGTNLSPRFDLVLLFFCACTSEFDSHSVPMHNIIDALFRWPVIREPRGARCPLTLIPPAVPPTRRPPRRHLAAPPLSDPLQHRLPELQSDPEGPRLPHREQALQTAASRL
jgi:hypothetical protein